uniref:CD27 antigen-like isoform X1 n=1 Tax=Myxine glutinosa TaxID=7769 RepID=UPI00358E234B
MIHRDWMLFVFSLAVGFQAPTIAAETVPECAEDEFLNQNGFCCLLCVKGTYFYRPCQIKRESSLCFPCSYGETYMDKRTKLTECHTCRKCDPETEIETSSCYLAQNRECDCLEGFDKVDATSVCVPVDRPENLPTYSDDKKELKTYLPITFSVVGALIFVMVALHISRYSISKKVSQALSKRFTRKEECIPLQPMEEDLV